ncbi:MAG TPA: hypothetical protein PKD09_14755 [Aggregatilinea sp.]|jgi:uncharacterized protein CbrC (UPF0167 family)|uniref:hypothetical protein n=1 Tax=Aggregatilinea sp. TaxID=2806333 RepID=UPI002D115765|nr:hypothetical protein [Aggregatilinea sp.]HML22909.1 hypothetical protein [Aggregatilinea sp.]
MPAFDQGTGDLIAFIVRRMACDHCGESYHDHDVKVTQDDGIQRTLTATCPVCGQAQQITAYDQPPYYQLHPAVRVNVTPITEAEVAAWRRFLTSFHGDMWDLLAAVTG